MVEGSWRVLIGDVTDSADLPRLRLEKGSAEWLGQDTRPAGTYIVDDEQVMIRFPGEKGDGDEVYYETFAMQPSGDQLIGECYWGFAPIPEDIGNAAELSDDLFCDPAVMIRDDRSQR
jgi:hypothetical protein